MPARPDEIRCLLDCLIPLLARGNHTKRTFYVCIDADNFGIAYVRRFRANLIANRSVVFSLVKQIPDLSFSSPAIDQLRQEHHFFWVRCARRELGGKCDHGPICPTAT
jgi:hypothetical protein